MTISLRLNEADGALIRRYAEIHGLTVSEIVRQSVLERIEEEFDLQAYHAAKASFDADPETFTLDEVEKELGLQ